MQFLNLLALSAVFLVQETEPSNLFTGDDTENTTNILRIPSDSSISSTSTSSVATDRPNIDSDSDGPSWGSKLLSTFKNIKGRRRFSFTERPSVWDRMNALRGSPGYIIGLYRSRSEDKNKYLSFESSPDKIRFLGKKSDRILIQSVPNPPSEQNANKRLCIFTQDPFQEQHLGNLELFVQEMIAAKGSEKIRKDVFKRYKKQMGLPKLGFDYKIYAWETNSDCAFYNLGIPRNIANNLQNIPQAETEITTVTFSTNATYTVQLSQTVANVNVDSQIKLLPVNLMFMNRYLGSSNEPSCRVKPVSSHFESLNAMFDQIQRENKIVGFRFDDTAVEGNKKLCSALFKKNNNEPTPTEGALKLADLASHVEAASKQGIIHFRSQQVNLYSSAFEAFSTGESNEIILATWEPINNSC